MRSWLTKSGRRQGDIPRERVERAKVLLSELRTDKEIVEILMLEYDCSQSTAYTDIKKAKEHSFTSEFRERMQLGLIESYRRIVRECLSAPRARYSEALAALAKIQAAFKLNLTTEELLGDDELRDQVVKATVANMHSWDVEQLQMVFAEAKRLLEVARQGPIGGDKKLE